MGGLRVAHFFCEFPERAKWKKNLFCESKMGASRYNLVCGCDSRVLK
jgi:hypothetical protein